MNKTLEFLYSLRNQGSRFGIDRIQSLCEELENPQTKYPSIHVAGTNGKGSVCTMLDNVYRTLGTGLVFLLHLIYWNWESGSVSMERIYLLKKLNNG